MRQRVHGLARAARALAARLRVLATPRRRPSPREGAIYIVAMYKCGTSWLSSCFAAHPQTHALRELDIVRALVGSDGKLRAPAERVAGIFSGSSWCRAPYAEVLDFANEPAERFVSRLRAGFAPRSAVASAADAGAVLSCWQLEDRVAAALVERLREADSPRAAFAAFMAVAAGQGSGRVVMKAADQIAVFAQLQGLAPRAAKIAIVRDGRDAAISAQHFKQLMREEDAPWLRGDADYWRLLQGWRMRARWVREHAQRGEIYLLRYEDLTLDFDGTFAALLRWLGLDATADVVQRAREATDFEALTGRKRGEAAKAVQRSGAIREWLAVLGAAEQARAWEIAGAELAAFGYRRDGEFEPLSPALVMAS